MHNDLFHTAYFDRRLNPNLMLDDKDFEEWNELFGEAYHELYYSQDLQVKLATTKFFNYLHT